MIIKEIMKLVQNKYPTCTVINSTMSIMSDVQRKCNSTPRELIVKHDGVEYKVMVCTGSFNTYVLKVEEIEQ